MKRKQWFVWAVDDTLARNDPERIAFILAGPFSTKRAASHQLRSLQMLCNLDYVYLWVGSDNGF